MISEPAGIELEGDRQQQRDGQRRADAGQHADRGAEQHADQREQQVHRLQRRRRGRGARESKASMAGPQNRRSSGPAGSDRVRSLANIRKIDDGRARGRCARSMRMARRPKAVAVAANSDGGRRDEAAAEPDDGDQRRRGRRGSGRSALRIEAFALGEVAAPRQRRSCRARARARPAATTIGHGLRADAVGRRELQRATCPRRSRAAISSSSAAMTMPARSAPCAIRVRHGAPSPRRHAGLSTAIALQARRGRVAAAPSDSSA